MAIDPSIPLSGRTSVAFDPFQTLGQLYNLDARRQQMRMMQQQEQANALRLQQAQQAQADEQAKRNAFNAGPDRKAIIESAPAWMRGEIQNVFDKEDKSKMEIETAKHTLAQAKSARWANLALGVHLGGNTPDALEYAFRMASVDDEYPEEAKALREQIAQDPSAIAKLTSSLIASHPSTQTALTNLEKARREAEKDAIELPGVKADVERKQKENAGTDAQGVTAAQRADDARANRQVAAYEKQVSMMGAADRKARGMSAEAKATAIRWKENQLAELEKQHAEAIESRDPKTDWKAQDEGYWRKKLGIENSYRVQIGLAPLTKLPAEWGQPGQATAPAAPADAAAKTVSPQDTMQLQMQLQQAILAVRNAKQGTPEYQAARQRLAALRQQFGGK
jgi:hypothetical protein